MNPLATTDELQERIDWTMSEGEILLAEGALTDLSDEARLYGSESWTTPANTPRQVINLVMRAAIRYLRNPDGYVMSRAGDETVQWSDRHGDSETAAFTDREIRMLKQFAGAPVIYSVEILAWNTKPHTPSTGYVPGPLENDKPFPLFAEDYT